MKIIFKHSNRCPVSMAAKYEMDRFMEENGNRVEYEFIDVIADRPRSNQVAQEFGITHESPQVIILDDEGKVSWYASHHRITQQNILAALQ